MAKALPFGDVAFGVGEEFTLSTADLDPCGFEVVFEGDAQPIAADKFGEGDVQVQTAAMAALVEQGAGDADVF